jgi:MFS family permease
MLRDDATLSETAPPDIAPSDDTTVLSTAARSTAYVIGVLTLVNTLNHLDRQIISILAEPIKLEFGLADWQLGLLTGLSFALVYGVVSLPLAYIADRTNRSLIISVSLGAWSLLTSLSGLVQNFAQLVVARVCIGMAEAGSGAPSQSLITERVPRSQRATALAILSIGIPLGSFVGMAFGGVLLDQHGWRTAMMLAGAPGLLLAIVMVLTIRDPSARNTRATPAVRDSISTAGFLSGLAAIIRIRSFRYVTLGGMCITFVNYNQSAFLASFFFRAHADSLDGLAGSSGSLFGLSMGAAALLGIALGAAKGLPGVLGTLLGGRITDRLAARNIDWLARVPAYTTWLRILLVLGVFLSPAIELALIFVVLQAIVVGMGTAAGFSSVQGMAPPHQRSLAASVFLFVLNVGGLGLGPITVGLFSDGLQAGGLSAAEGLRWALILSGVSVLALGGWLKWQARLSIARDTVS